MWKEIVLNNSEQALEEMVTYCKGDVELLEKIYNKMSSYFPHKTHFGVLNGEEKYSCPECGSNNMAFSKRRLTALGNHRIQLQCKDCGKYHTISERIYDQYSSDTTQNLDLP